MNRNANRLQVFSVLTSCLLACILIAYCMFISTYKALIHALFYMNILYIFISVSVGILINEAKHRPEAQKAQGTRALQETMTDKGQVKHKGYTVYTELKQWTNQQLPVVTFSNLRIN